MQLVNRESLKASRLNMTLEQAVRKITKVKVNMQTFNKFKSTIVECDGTASLYLPTIR